MNIIGLLLSFVVPVLMTWIPPYEIISKIIITIVLLAKFLVDFDSAKQGHSGRIYRVFPGLSSEKNLIIACVIEVGIRVVFTSISLVYKMWLPFAYGTIVCLVSFFNFFKEIKDLMALKNKRFASTEVESVRKRKISILGDSISTLEGYNPYGYAVFYDRYNCLKANLQSSEETWWGIIIHRLGAELLVNNSWSGSRVSKLPDREELFPSGCSDERTGGLHVNEVLPDIIIVYLGFNDWANGVDVISDFFESYNSMILKLKSNYPEATICCCTLNTTFMSSNPMFSFPCKNAGKDIREYNDAIKSVAFTNECILLDLAKYNLPYDTIDGSHPNRKGMALLADSIWMEMTHSNNIF